MEEILIAVQRKAELLTPVLKKEAQVLQKKWAGLQYREEEEGEYHLYIFSLPRDEISVLKSVFSSLSAVLTHHIINQREEDIIARLIEEQFYFLEPEIKERLYDSFPKEKDELEKKCRRLIFFSLLQHFFSEGDLNLEGFINFRIREYWEILSMTLLDQINALFFDDDQREILYLLRRILVLEKLHLIKGGIE